MNPLISAGADPAMATRPGNIGNAREGEKYASLRKAATDLEAAFLTEMLKSAGFGKARDSNGGGAGEDQFSSLLIRAQAEQMTLAGGIGLAESLFNALLEAQNDTPSRTGSD